LARRHRAASGRRKREKSPLVDQPFDVGHRDVQSISDIREAKEGSKVNAPD
jgi:hypothetical protein